MKMRERWPLILLLLFLVISFPVVVYAGEESSDEILVFVAASLTDAMKEIKDKFEEEKNGGGKVFLSFGGSGTLYRQILKGAPADIFISASATQADALELDGFVLLDTRKDLLTNTLVVIVSRGGGVKIEQPGDLARREVGKIAIGEPGSVPAGAYAKEALENLGLWEDLHPKIVPALDVRTVLAYVERQAAGAGIVYKTDALISDEVEVAYEFPEDSHTRIIYPAVILKDTGAGAMAGEFMDFISSAEAIETFESYGFKAAEGS